MRPYGQLHVTRFLRWIEHIAGPVVVRYWFDATVSGHPSAIHWAAREAGFGVRVLRSVPQYNGASKATRFKQVGVDVALAIGTVASLERDCWRRLVLVAGDGDFCPLADFVVEAGAELVLVGNHSTTSRELLRRAKRHHDLHDIAQQIIVPGSATVRHRSIGDNMAAQTISDASLCWNGR
jgi:hypothetical protein